MPPLISATSCWDILSLVFNVMEKKIYILLLLITLGCTTSRAPDKQYDWLAYKQSNPHEYFETRPILGNKLSDRFVELTEDDIADLRLMASGEMSKHLKSNVISVSASNEKFSWFKNEIDSIPSEIQELLLKRVHGWSLVENLGASGTILGLRNDYHYYEKGIVLIDISIFRKTYEERCTYRESTAYQLKENENVSCNYEGSNISFAKTIFYHEAGHLFDNLNPMSTKKMAASNHQLFPFNRRSWVEHDHEKFKTKSKFDDLIPNRNELKYYSADFTTKIPSNKLDENLSGWEKSNFFTLYSMTNPIEDWAESFTHYLISKYHNGKYVVRYKDSLGKTKKYESCTKADCTTKFRLIETYIKNIDLFI